MAKVLLCLVVTTCCIISGSTAWVFDSRAIPGAVHRSIPMSHRESCRRISILQAAKNSEDSSTASAIELPSFSSIFNRNAEQVEELEQDEDGFSFFTQQKTATTKFSNSDADIENFSSETDSNQNLILVPLTLLVASAIYSAAPEGSLETAKEVLADPGAALERVVEITDSMGNLGMAYFGVAYCIAEILAVPAIPLTASAGYLFGPLKGTAVVLLSASVAAGVSFQIGRTLLRDFVEEKLNDFPKFAKIDKAIGKEGFKLMLLLRLSPVFPFALSNYLYGASSINFPAFFWGTLLGFAPGTLAYVYTGYVGKALTGDAGGDVYPWYVYVGGLSLFAGLLKVIADTATRVVEEIEAEESENTIM